MRPTPPSDLFPLRYAGRSYPRPGRVPTCDAAQKECDSLRLDADLHFQNGKNRRISMCGRNPASSPVVYCNSLMPSRVGLLSFGSERVCLVSIFDAIVRTRLRSSVQKRYVQLSFSLQFSQCVCCPVEGSIRKKLRDLHSGERKRCQSR